MNDLKGILGAVKLSSLPGHLTRYVSFPVYSPSAWEVDPSLPLSYSPMPTESFAVERFVTQQVATNDFLSQHAGEASENWTVRLTENSKRL